MTASPVMKAILPLLDDKLPQWVEIGYVEERIGNLPVAQLARLQEFELEVLLRHPNTPYSSSELSRIPASYIRNLLTRCGHPAPREITEEWAREQVERVAEHHVNSYPSYGSDFGGIVRNDIARSATLRGGEFTGAIILERITALQVEWHSWCYMPFGVPYPVDGRMGGRSLSEVRRTETEVEFEHTTLVPGGFGANPRTHTGRFTIHFETWVDLYARGVGYRKIEPLDVI